MGSTNGGSITLRLSVAGAEEVKTALNELGPVGKKALKQIEEAAAAAGTASGFTRNQLLELTHVARSSFDALAAGANPLRVLMMEGGRVTQALGSGPGGLAGGFASLAKLINPATIAALAFATALGGVVLLEQKYEGQHRALLQALEGSGAGTGITIASLEKIATATANAGKGSIAFAEETERAFIGIRGMSEANLSVAVGLVADFAARTGQDGKAAAADLGKAMENPIDGAQRLNRELGFLTPTQIDAIRHFQDMGKYAEANGVMLHALEDKVKGARGELNDLGQTLEKLKGQFDKASNSAGSFFFHLTHKYTPEDLPALQQQRDELSKSHENSYLFMAPKSEQLAKLDKLIADLKTEQAKAAQDPAGNNKAGQVITDLVSKYGLTDQRGGLKGAIDQLTAELKKPNLSAQRRADIEGAIAGANRQLAALDRKERGPEKKDWAPTELVIRDKADKDLAAAKTALATSIEARAAAEREQIDLAAKAQKDEIAKQLAGDKNRNAVIAQTSSEIDLATSLKKRAIDEKERQQLAAAQLAADQDDLSTFRSAASVQLAQAATQVERLKIALATLDAEKKVELEAANEALIRARQGGSQREIDQAQARVDNIDRRYQSARTNAVLSNMTPLQSYMSDLKKANDSIGESLQSVAVDGFKSLNDGIASAIVNSKRLSDAFSSVAKNIIADLARIAVQKYITAPLADALGFGGPPIPAHAKGGFAQGWSLVGEGGPELVNFTQPGRVYTNDSVRDLIRPSSQAAASAYQAGAPVQLGDTHYTFNAPGADPQQLMRLQLMLDQHRREEPKRFVAYYQAMRKQRL